MDDAIPVSTRLRRTTPYHDAYTVRVYEERFASLATARPADARRWVATTRWLHRSLFYRGHLIVGLGVQWTPTRAQLRGETPVPATLQLCVGHRCLVFHLARADAVPEALRRFLADPRVTFVGSGAAHDGRMLWDHYGLDVARGMELRAAAGMGNASVEQMADRFLGYPGICKPREVAMSVWHAPRLSLDQVQYASVDAYLAFRLGVVLLCPGAAAPPPPPARAQHQQRAPVVQRVPAIVNPAPPRAPVVVHGAPPAAVRRQAPAPLVVVRAAPPVLFGVPVPAVGGDAVITGSKIVADDSDTESEMESYDDVFRAATRGLPVRAYASDSDYSLDSSDGFEDVRFGAFTDEEDEEDDGSYTGTGSLVADDIVGNEDDDEEDEEGCDEDDDDDEEEDCNVDDLEDEEGCKQADEDDEEGYNEDDQEEGYNHTSGAGMDGSAEVVIDGCEEEDGALAQDDWYDHEVDYGYDQEVDFGFDQDDEQEFEEFCLL
ncbi:hypothetical protein BDA96_02G008300 [Sorghum bicolor]|uniref:3'-5' exonuclease domain-containing protein n=1 Tax=Sorghum bicolor TaxID=4558 RepID=A0A921UTP9_SORBI|nr:hypothetical protein BDA96_02G008300 [Sorghum bicolor]